MSVGFQYGVEGLASGFPKLAIDFRMPLVDPGQELIECGEQQLMFPLCQTSQPDPTSSGVGKVTPMNAKNVGRMCILTLTHVFC